MKPTEGILAAVDEAAAPDDPAKPQRSSPKRRLLGFAIIYLLAWPLITVVAIALYFLLRA